MTQNLQVIFASSQGSLKFVHLLETVQISSQKATFVAWKY
jgi:hypothetical protein